MEVLHASWTSEFSHSLGQTRKFGRATGKSALASITDIVRLMGYVRKGPTVVNRESIACETPLANPAHVAAENAED
jgi:hypothetical protein